MKQIPLSTRKTKTTKNDSKYFALIDDEDYELIKHQRWSVAFINGEIKYVVGWEKGKAIKLHRKLMGITDPNVWVDHRDRNPLNNQRENLRIATRSQNMANRRSMKEGGTSQYLGVSYVASRNRWQANIQKDKKYIRLGYFKTEIEAAEAYDKKAKELHGEFANLNFP